MDVNHENRLKRLKYRSQHRGCKETDLILGQFAEKRLAAMDAPGLDSYEQLLDEDDALIWDWVIGKEAPSKYHALISLLTQYNGQK